MHIDARIHTPHAGMHTRTHAHTHRKREGEQIFRKNKLYFVHKII